MFKRLRKLFNRKPVEKPLHNCEEAGCITSSQKNGVNNLGNKTQSKEV
jgi:hypothetical protein